MALTSSSDPNTLYTNYDTLSNSTTLLQPENLCCMREARKKLQKKKLMKGQVILKLKKNVMYPLHPTACHMIARKPVLSAFVPMPPVSLPTCCPYEQDYSYPLGMNDWHPMNTPLFTVQSVPVIVQRASPIFAPHICPFAGTVLHPVISPIVPPTFLQDDETNVSNYINEYNSSTEQIDGITSVTDEQPYSIQEETHAAQLEINNDVETMNVGNQEGDPLELYLTLPKDLFPTARMLTLDPNPIIDEFCKLSNLQFHTPWILDLEFGIPRSPTTRPIPTYDVKFNSIHCKNAPDAIHPSFESCDPSFKRVLLFYYDCIVSVWYRGYVIMNYDRSVENFQSWLLLPMQVLGMCWP